MLRSFYGQRILPLVVVFALLIPLLVFPASAVYDYNDFITDIEVDGDKDIVTITVPADSFKIQFVSSEIGLNEIFYSNTFSWSLEALRTYSLYAYGFSKGGYLDVTNIPDGSLVTFDVSISSVQPAGGYGTPSWSTQIYYYDNGKSYLGQNNVSHGKEAIRDNLTFEMTMNKVTGSSQATFNLIMRELQPFYSCDFTFTIESLNLTLSISSLYRLQEQTGKTNEILSAVEKKLEQNGQKLDDVIDKIEQNGDKLDDTNDKLDDANDKLDKLPGEIGDEIQGVIDNEKNEAEDAGNKFVDQILDALPDPSTEVLAALKGLTDATSYTGTDAVLPIPALVLPGIAGVFPETVIWEGAELDFAEYMNVLPPALLSLVRNLFTIAIVLFCVYELKGIISYCLTLRENKGG